MVEVCPVVVLIPPPGPYHPPRYQPPPYPQSELNEVNCFSWPTPAWYPMKRFALSSSILVSPLVLSCASTASLSCLVTRSLAVDASLRITHLYVLNFEKSVFLSKL